MKYASAALQNFLANNSTFLMADLYTLTLMANGPSGTPGTSSPGPTRIPPSPWAATGQDR